MVEEIDFEIEKKNMETCREFFEGRDDIYVPKVYPDLCSHRICMMEFIHGIKVSNVKKLREESISTRRVAQLCVQAFSDMMFQTNFLHVDPHAGNLLVRTNSHGDPQLVLLDHGMYNYVDPSFTSYLQELWLAMVSQDHKEVERLCRVYGMEDFAQLLSLSLTGRSLDAQNKLWIRIAVMIRFGEEMSEELLESVEDRVAETVRNITTDVFSKRIGVVASMMNARPKDFTYVFRVVEMVANGAQCDE